MLAVQTDNWLSRPIKLMREVALGTKPPGSRAASCWLAFKHNNDILMKPDDVEVSMISGEPLIITRCRHTKGHSSGRPPLDCRAVRGATDPHRELNSSFFLRAVNRVLEKEQYPLQEEFTVIPLVFPRLFIGARRME